ncbi:MAG TPA: class F sortase [Nonomuraea sp.]|nr:class F sortase [Nonomuraea sp.]
MTQPPQKSPMSRAMPALLIAGSLGGVGVVMVGLLSFIPPVDDGSGPAPVAQGEPTPVQFQKAGAFKLAPTVGPGGKNAPLTPARLDAPPPLAAVPAVAPIPPVKSKAARTKIKPTRIKIPKIKVNSKIKPLGLAKTGALATPPLTRPNITGWYNKSPLPGEVGPSILNGHVSTKKGAAVFKRLDELTKGDHIYLYRSDGKVARYTVSGVEQVSKKTFPTSRVYGNTNDSQLRLITCGGVFNRKEHSYTDNIVVYATLSKKKG